MIEFTPFAQQEDFLLDQHRFQGAFAGKRGGKTEVGAIKGIIHTEEQPNYVNNGRDPHIGLIIAPTHDMLMRLSLRKFLAFAKDFEYDDVSHPFPVITWHNGSLVYGLSADNPQRIEGIKAHWAWLDEVFQMKEQVYLEAQARVADTEGKVWCTGSLGTQYNNPKAHWAYKYFKKKADPDTRCFEWATFDNPHFPRAEIARLKSSLDAKTFRQMYELSWDIQGTNLVYEDFGEDSLLKTRYTFNPRLPTYVAVDWGWTHPAAVLFLQYDPLRDTVYLFDEIYRSKMTLEVMWTEMQAKLAKYPGIRIKEWICDIAGLQTREQTAISNVEWFKQAPRGIYFKYRTSAVTHGISIVRSYIKNAIGQRRFFIDPETCPKTVEEFPKYAYKVNKASGELGEEPIKEGEDALSALRYFFVNELDYTVPTESMEVMDRWSLTGRAR